MLCIITKIQHKLQMSWWPPGERGHDASKRVVPAAVDMASEKVVPAANSAATAVANAIKHQIYDSIACPDCKRKAFLFYDINQKCPIHGDIPIAIARQKKMQQINSIVCPECKMLAKLTEDINTRCSNCKKKSQGGSKRKSKSQRRKKSKSQRRRKSIKRRH